MGQALSLNFSWQTIIFCSPESYFIINLTQAELAARVCGGVLVQNSLCLGSLNSKSLVFFELNLNFSTSHYININKVFFFSIWDGGFFRGF
jgi:hypothetical protein